MSAMSSQKKKQKSNQSKDVPGELAARSQGLQRRRRGKKQNQTAHPPLLLRARLLHACETGGGREDALEFGRGAGRHGT